MPKKGTRIKMYIGIALVVLLIALGVGAIAFVYNNQRSSGPTSTTVGVHVGDTFTYRVTGNSILFSSNADPEQYSPGFSQLNQTDYLKITITAVNGSYVYFNRDWRYLNGTDLQEPEWVDVSTGNQSSPYSFFEIYAANLKVGDLTRPSAGSNDQTTVNSTITQTYVNSTRPTNYFSVSEESYLASDVTHSTIRDETTDIYFDRQTGMLLTIDDIQQYNNPQMNLLIEITLANSSVWVVQ